MADDQSLSQQDVQDLQEISTHLPDGHPMQKKLSTLLNSQPTQFEKDRTPGADSGFVSGAKQALGANGPAPSFTDTMKTGLEAGLGGPGLSVAKTLYGAVKNAPENYKASGLAGTLGPLVGVDPVSMRNRAEHGDTAGVAGEAAVPAAMAAAPLVGEGLGRVGGAARRGLSRAAYSGAQPRPGLQAIGNALEHPTTIPGKLATYTAKKAFPPPVEQVRAVEGEANATKLGERMTEVEKARQKELSDNARMGREEEKQHRQFAGSVEDAEVARQKELAANERLKTMHGNDLMRRGEPVSTGQPIGERNGVNILPEPREAMPGDKPGAMWSAGREDVLPAAARRGTPGAGDVLRNIGQPVLYLPREGVGFPGPRVATPEAIGEPIGAEAQAPPAVRSGGSIGDPIGVRRQKQYERILSDPAATEEERSKAAEMIRRLRSYR